MSWRDGQRFDQMYAEYINSKDFELTDICLLENAKHLLKYIYNQGYIDGFKEGQTFDSKWDAD
jgi:hypothetical protein